MKVIVALSLLAFASAAKVPAAFDCEPPTCTDTNTLWPHHDRTKYWLCIPDGFEEWKAVERHCPGELLFSYNHQVCVWEQDWENVCAGEVLKVVKEAPVARANCQVPECFNTTTLFPMNDPTHYYQCAPEAGCDKWRAVKMPCPKGLWFSGKYQVCTWCSEWENPCGLDPAPECECSDPGPGPGPTTKSTTTPSSTTDGGNPIEGGCEPPICFNTTRLFPHENPTRFWQCAPEAGCDEWKPVEQQCPSPLFFSEKHQVCDWCNDHTCESPIRRNPAPKCF